MTRAPNLKDPPRAEGAGSGPAEPRLSGTRERIRPAAAAAPAADDNLRCARERVPRAGAQGPRKSPKKR